MMTLRRPGWFITRTAVIVGALGSAATTRAGDIRLWPTAVVQEDSVTVADVGALRGFESAELDALSVIVVSPSPRAGGEMLVTSSDVRDALREAKFNLGTTRIFGSSRCRVSRPVEVKAPESPESEKAAAKQRARSANRTPARAEKVTPATDTLASVLRQWIASQVDDPTGVVEARFGPVNKDDLALKTSDCTFKIRKTSGDRLGLLTFDVTIESPGEAPRMVPMVVEAQLAKQVVVARGPINQGRIIEQRDVKLDVRRFNELGDIGVCDASAVVGQRARRFITRGEMLRGSWVEEKPLVHRGERVTIWSRSQGFVIKTAGRAQGEGRLGDVIEVSRDGLNRQKDLLEAVVTGPGTVTISEATTLVAQR